MTATKEPLPLTAQASETARRPGGELGHVPALDGMRGMAVLLVFLFHLRVAGFRSGYMGVDVFFVLSGFLITSLLLNEMHRTGRLSLTGFWARRVRRLMPALAVLLIVIAVVTKLTATYSEMSTMRGDLLSTTTYVANWHFISAGGYFQDTGFLSPLRHTWSLAIEEQFYLGWPLLLAGLGIVFRRSRPAIALMAFVGIALSALALAILWSPGSSDRAYMGTDARMFEPMIGALGAALIASPRFRERIRRRGGLLAALGVAGAFVGLWVVASRPSSYFFGGAVAVSVATALVIASVWLGRGGPILRFLEWKPLVWLGVISYGVYLWHWPFVVWLHPEKATGIRAVVLGTVVVAATIGVAALSYVLIERPIRRGLPARRRRRSAEQIRRRVALVAVPLVMVAVAGTSVAATTVPPPPKGVPSVVFTGDSVPLRLQSTLERVASQRGWRIASAARGGCPVSGENPIRPNGTLFQGGKCPGLVPAYQDSVIEQMDADVVVWWDRWSISSFVTASGDVMKSGTRRFWTARREALARTVDRLSRSGRKVLLLATEPPGKGIWSRCGGPPPCGWWFQFMVNHYDDITTKWNHIMRHFAATHPSRAAFASITRFVCRDRAVPCNDRVGGVLARPDGAHYEGDAAIRIANTIADIASPMLRAGQG